MEQEERNYSNRIITWGNSQADGYAQEDTIIGINSFVKRQTKASRFSHYEGTDDELLTLIAQNWQSATAGYRQGVLLVPVPSEGFYSGVVRLSEGDTLQGSYESRREGETPRKSVVVVGRDKMPAQTVEVVLYASTVLAEDKDNELPVGDSSWEVISINASPEKHEMPINPEALMHNHFGSDGGTRTNLSDEQFVAMLKDSFIFWSDKALAANHETNNIVEFNKGE